MKKEFIPYEIALELKELGFNEPCFAHYINSDFIIQKAILKSSGMLYYTQNNINPNNQYKYICIAPLYQQVLRWFREKHNISGSVSQDWYQGEFLGYEGYIESIDGEHNVNTKTFDTYEEAELECIKELIKFVK